MLNSNVHLVESESCAPLIPLVGELMNSNVISTSSFFLMKDYHFLRRRSGTVPENFKPCILYKLTVGSSKVAEIHNTTKYVLLSSAEERKSYST